MPNSADIPADPRSSSDELLISFLDLVEEKGISLYPEQESAILELYEGKNVIQNTPTGSGKSLVAASLHYLSLHQGRRSVYTCPIKALANEKWLSLCREFGPENVGLSTGDATVNREAPILCCTAEILANIALRNEPEDVYDDIIIDEFHYYSDPDRGMAWQIPLLTLNRSRFLLMSATLSNTDFFEKALTRLTGRKTVIIQSGKRPVPLGFEYSEISLAQTVEQFVLKDRCPLYIVHFTQKQAGESAQDFTSINVCTREEKSAIAEAIRGFRFNTTYGPVIRRWIRCGIGVHHAGLLPRYRILIEQLAQKGLLKIICGTDTLGVGVDIPIRTVIFTRLCKYDGYKTRLITVREFHQIAGRAGRRGFDDRGWVVVQSPAYVANNLKLKRKAAEGGKKFVRRKPPDRNFVPWDKKTFKRLVRSSPEPMVSRFEVTPSMLINVMSRKNTNGCKIMRHLIRNCHDSSQKKKEHIRRAWNIFQVLLDRKIVELLPKGAQERRIRVNVDLQENFSMNRIPSLYLYEVVEGLDMESEDYHLNVLTLVESIIEDPCIILHKQLDKVRSRAIDEMIADGVNYYLGMDKSEFLWCPKPVREFIFGTFNEFAGRHPRLGEANIRPKSIAREMYENFSTFDDFIKRFSLAWAEGLLLRYLTNVYQTLVQTVPENCKSEQVREIESFLEVLITGTDSSLLDEWKRMLASSWNAPGAGRGLHPEPLRDITRDTIAFQAHIRQMALFFLRHLSGGHVQAALLSLLPDDASPPDGSQLEQQVKDYLDSRECIRLDPEARNRCHSHFSKDEVSRMWVLHQTLVDPEEHNDWFAEFRIDPAQSSRQSRPAMTFVRIHHLE